MLFHKYISTGLGIGYIGRGAGTISAAAVCLSWYILQSVYALPSVFWLWFTILITITGIWAAGKVEILWGKDSNRVVIDEIAGMCITLLFVPATFNYLITGFILFRFFDIIKPLFIRNLEALPGGWGVMADDILAGMYSNFVLQVLIIAAIFK
jgi:phosphatidylglycerophosphatase A